MNNEITNLEISINMNLWALNDEIGYDTKIKEKVEVKSKKNVNVRWIDLKKIY
jgi:hypothetical protein